jgi:hypothetical protein
MRATLCQSAWGWNAQRPARGGPLLWNRGADWGRSARVACLELDHRRVATEQALVRAELVRADARTHICHGDVQRVVRTRDQVNRRPCSGATGHLTCRFNSLRSRSSRVPPERPGVVGVADGGVSIAYPPRPARGGICVRSFSDSRRQMSGATRPGTSAPPATQ